MQDEGYIKFQIHRQQQPIAFDKELVSTRQKLYRAGLIGMYPNGIGFGNVSKRQPQTNNPAAFLITATATGGMKRLSANEIVLVKKCNPATNEVWCEGLKDPSSESMTHYVIYKNLPEVQSVIHIHHHALWEHLLKKLPHTAAQIPYGTPEMASAVEKLLQKTEVQKAGIFAMAGHEEGILTWLSAEKLIELVKKT